LAGVGAAAREIGFAAIGPEVVAVVRVVGAGGDGARRGDAGRGQDRGRERARLVAATAVGNGSLRVRFAAGLGADAVEERRVARGNTANAAHTHGRRRVREGAGRAASAVLRVDGGVNVAAVRLRVTAVEERRSTVGDGAEAVVARPRSDVGRRRAGGSVDSRAARNRALAAVSGVPVTVEVVASAGINGARARGAAVGRDSGGVGRRQTNVAAGAAVIGIGGGVGGASEVLAGAISIRRIAGGYLADAVGARRASGLRNLTPSVAAATVVGISR